MGGLILRVDRWKARPGLEREYEDVRRLLAELKIPLEKRRETLTMVGVSAYEEMGAPLVGSSTEADAWVSGVMHDALNFLSAYLDKLGEEPGCEDLRMIMARILLEWTKMAQADLGLYRGVAHLAAARDAGGLCPLLPYLTIDYTVLASLLGRVPKEIRAELSRDMSAARSAEVGALLAEHSEATGCSVSASLADWLIYWGSRGYGHSARVISDDRDRPVEPTN